MLFPFFPKAFFVLFFCFYPWVNWSPHFIPFTIQAQAGSNEFRYIWRWNSIHKLNKWVKVSLTHRIFIWWWIKVCKKVGSRVTVTTLLLQSASPEMGQKSITLLNCLLISLMWPVHVSGMTPLCRLDKFCKINASINVSWPQEFKFEIWLG